jgi:hypothetical protein
VEWEDGTITMEPLSIIGADDPATCAKYAKENGLLEQEGWKRFRRLAKGTKLMKRMMNQVALAAKRKGPIYMFGIQVPRNEEEARELDKIYKEKFGIEKWKLAEEDEVDSLNEYDTFKDRGIGRPPPGYKFIKVFFVYAVKHDLRHKARLVAGGHMTPAQGDSYSSVISLKSMRIAILAGEINGCKAMAGDVGNAYLEALTKEMVYFIAGPAFGPLQGHILVIYKALYGLRTSGARFHERFADTLRSMGFVQCKNEQDLWMRDAESHYEYVCVYVDDLLAIMKEPEKFFKELTKVHGYKLKGVGEPEYHLGGNYFRDPDGTLVWGAQKYISKLLENYERAYGELPPKYRSPMDKEAHPELDESPLMGPDDVKKYQSHIGALQWCVTLGRFDIACAVMTMSRFRIQPRVDHHKTIRRIYGYLRHTKDAAIRFRTEVPDYSHLEEDPYDWGQSVYHGVQEDIPDDLPVPKGKAVRVTTYVDANLLHCRATGRSATGILHIINSTIVDWFSKKQATVESATYGSEFMAARQAIQQIIDLRLTLRYMGVPLDGPAWMFGDNMSVIKSSTIPASTLNKRHNALSYHTVRSAVAAGIVNLHHIPGEENLADCLTKHLEPRVLEPLLRPHLLWQGKDVTYGPKKKEE